MTGLLNVGLAVQHGSRDQASPEGVADKLVDEALRPVDVARLPVRGALLLVTADWCSPPGSVTLPADIRKELAQRLGYAVPLIGGSTTRLYCSTAQPPVIVSGALLLLLCTDDIRLTVASLPEPYQGPAEERRERLADLARELEEAAGTRLAASSEKDLLGFLPGFVPGPSGGRAYYDNELYEEIIAAFDHRYRLVGGSACSHIQPRLGYQFANDECLESGLALALVESDLSTGATTAHGFVPHEDVVVSVDSLVGGTSTGYDIAILDGKPAPERMRQLADEGYAPLGKVVFGQRCYGIDHLISPIHESTGEKGFVRLNRRIHRSDRLLLMDAAPRQMVEAAAGAIRNACHSANADFSELNLILAFSCIGRYFHYEGKGHAWDTAVTELREAHPGVPIVAMLCTGEFGVDEWRRPHANNMSVSICCVADRYARRARIRDTQNRLLSAGIRVSVAGTPREVMDAALRGAVAAGASGGQICLVDYATKRILGAAFGHALQAPGSKQNWPAVLKVTHRTAPATVGGEFPAELMDCSLAVGHNVPLKVVRSIDPEEDVLTLVARTLRAVLVSDSRDPRFHCNQRAVSACIGEEGAESEILTHLAIPLVGAQGRAIATLQVGLQSGSLLDREALRLWVGYAQKVAAALERAQQAEERDIVQQITEVAEAISQQPVDPRRDRHEWCQRYVEAVVRALGAENAHMRLLRRGIEGDVYRLVAGVGPLERLREKVRPETRSEHGSCSRELLAGGGRITNTKAETAEFNKAVKPTSGEPHFQKAFLRELSQLAATAMLPIRSGKEVLGSFVADSNRAYFFTEQRRRIARLAADVAGTLVRAKDADYDRAVLEGELNWMMDILTTAMRGGADQLLRLLMERLCRAARADVGSLFLWHDGPAKLILHVAHNWFHPLEGEAWYELGEGWTGSVGLEGHAVRVVDPLLVEPPPCTRKWYDHMVPPEYRVPEGEGDARVGIRLTAGADLVGVATLTYYAEHSDLLAEERERVRELGKALAALLTLGVEAAKQEMLLQHVRRLMEAEHSAAEAMMRAAGPDTDWQEVFDVVRDKFDVERVTLYFLQGGKLHHGYTSTKAGVETCISNVGPIEPSDEMRRLMVRKQAVLIGDPTRHLLERWPNSRGVRALFAVPVICTPGDVRGVLEFVNRRSAREHPFELFDEHEQRVAWDVARAIAGLIDHQEHHRAIEALRKQLTPAVQMGAKALASAMVMHQLMTPFARMQASVAWLMSYPDAPIEKRMEYLHRIESFCSDAVRGIRQTARTGTPDLRVEDLRTVVQRAVTIVKAQAPADIRFDVANEVSVPVHVEVDSIVGALVHLLANALDAMEGGGALTVSTAEAADGTKALLRIRNTGPRYTEEEVARFGVPGYTMKPGGEHLGFGVPLARQAVEMFGGALAMEPHPDGGVETTITLPRADRGNGQQ